MYSSSYKKTEKSNVDSPIFAMSIYFDGLGTSHEW